MIFDLQLFGAEPTGYNASYSSNTITIGGKGGPSLITNLSSLGMSYVGYKIGGTGAVGGLSMATAAAGISTLEYIDRANYAFALGGVSIGGDGTSGIGTATSLAVFAKGQDYTYKINEGTFSNISINGADGAKFDLVKFTTTAPGMSIGGIHQEGATFTFKNTTASSGNQVVFDTSNTLSNKKAVVIGNTTGSFSLTGASAATQLTGTLTVKSQSADTITVAAAGDDELNISGANVILNMTASGNLTSKISDSSSKIAITGGADGKTADVTLEAAKNVLFIGAATNTLNVNKIDEDSKLDISNDTTGKITNVLLGGDGYETITLGSKNKAKAGQVVATNFKESTGETAEGNVVVLGTSVKNVSLTNMLGGVATFAGDSIGSAVLTSKSVADSRQSFGINLQGTEGKVATLFLGNDAQNTQDKTDFESFDFIVGEDANKTVVLGDSTSKDQWFFGRSNIGDKTNTFFTDTAYYQDITTITGSNARAELIVNGSTNSMLITANGAGDTLWGGDNATVDTLVSAGGVRTEFATGSYDGKDTITGYRTGNDLTALSSTSDVLHILGGVNMMKAEDGAFTIGENSTNNVKLDALTSADGGNDMYLTFGIDGDDKVARVDVSSAGQDMTYNKNANYYIGQGSSSGLVIGTADGVVNFGYEDYAGLISVAKLDGSVAAAGSVLVGSNNRKTDVTASGLGASSVAGGFIVTDGIVNDAYNDNLVGGENTTFMVGQYMGDDKISNLADGDTIRFLNTKVTDLVNYANPSKNGTKFTFATNGGASITASSESKLSSLTNITAEFDDETLKWNGEEWTKA